MQDKTEEKIFADGLRGCWKMLTTLFSDLLERQRRYLQLSTITSNPQFVIGMLVVLFMIIWYLEVNRVFCIKIPRFLYEWFHSALDHCSNLQHSDGFAHVYAMQGRRPNMEDRFISLAINLDFETKSKPVRVNGVLDGHGGKVQIIDPLGRHTHGR